LIEEEDALGPARDDGPGAAAPAAGLPARPWLSYTDLEPIAAPAEEVAARLGVGIEQVHACGVEPYYTVAGDPVLSIRLVGVALGIRRSRRDAARVRERRRSARRACRRPARGRGGLMDAPGAPPAGHGLLDDQGAGSGAPGPTERPRGGCPRRWSCGP
jgi:hypothetical protein